MQMQATAPKGSKYQVKDDDMIFLIADTSKSWAVSIRYLSAGLAEHGFKALQRKAQIILKNVGHFNGDDYVRLSRVDVCVDFKSKPISRQLKPSLLDGLIAPKQSKARIFDKLDVFVRKGTIETLTLGTKGNLEISVYDKSKEITESSGKTWFYKLWNLEPKEAKKDVYRVEVRFWRNYLRNRNIKTFEEFVAYQKELINGAMYNYRLTVVNPNDTNRSRWSYHPIWVIARRELCNNCEEVLTVGRVVEGRSDILARQQTKQGAGLIRNINILYNNGTYKESFTPVIFGMLLRAMEEDDNHDRKVRLAKERYKYVDEAR
ncbi:MAG: Replication initiation factor [Alphaproteobacteria bacterium ADurb.Bin438]|nr:MAG: Replication initiation factor [Alphaproteobacteria bacterium ADurb.Bin438]